ncbi:MAG: hypothetical protein IEMM0007_2003 [bacterium]|nr:MAG: hypothetical protein IEMM0007_2003 [bacterium]
MAVISENEKRELLRLAESSSLRKDMRHLSSNRHNPFIRDGKVDVDAYIEFVTQYNEFINHEPKAFKPMVDKVMKL